MNETIKLDKYQQKAVTADGNILLIAGAGAGKTLTITKKIEYLIDNKICKKEEILVISFTNQSVLDLKRKIKYSCDIYTFHKLAMHILKDYNISFNLVSTDYLTYITNEYFHSIDDKSKYEILNYFHQYDYDSFLNSYEYKELVKLITTIIKIYKTNACKKEDFKRLFNQDTFLSKYTYIIKNIYDNELASSNSYDFDDLIIKATDVLNKPYRYKYIIVDEFQDTSKIRFNLINKLRILNDAYLFCVGDDYQSIYHFSGSDINIFLEFPKLVPNAKVLKLKYTYRNSQELIDIASSFIMKNKRQIKKDLISNKHIDKPIEFVYYLNPYKAFNKLYKRLKKENSDLLILGRNNNDIHKFTQEKVEFMTIHASKGLEAENIILINLVDDKYGFPNRIINNKLIEELNKTDKSYLYAEERRLFYVALTRCKKKVYLMVPLFHKSMFVKEILINKSS